MCLVALPKVFPSTARLTIVYFYHFHVPAGGEKNEKIPHFFEGHGMEVVYITSAYGSLARINYKITHKVDNAPN